MKIVIDSASEPIKWDKSAQGTLSRASQDAMIREIAVGIKKILDREGGIEVILTHRGGESPTMEQRIERVNTSGADALVALRLNASPYENLEGVEIFIASESVDSASQGAKKAGGALPLPFAYIPFQRESLALAHVILEEMERSGSFRVGPITPAPVYLLKRAAMASVLISCGYISNSKDASQLSRERYRDSLARVIAEAILKYKDSRRK
jgi:N-acetylmuramoyl-L-alanine amidase